MDSGRPSKNDRRSLALLLNNRVDDGHFFGCLAGNEVGISLRHGDRFMSHEFFQLKKCNLSRLGKPRGKCMAKSMESNMVSAIRITIIYPKSTKSITKRIRDTRNRCSVRSARLKNVLLRPTAVSEQHVYHITRGMDDLPFSPFRCDVNNSSMGINVLSFELENFRCPEARFQRKQRHIMELRAAFLQVRQEIFYFFRSKESDAPIVYGRHFPAASLARYRIGAEPLFAGDSMVNCSPKEAELMQDTLWRQHITQRVSNRGEYGGSHGRQWNGVNTASHMLVVLLEGAVNGFPFTSCPLNVQVNGIPHSEAIHLDKVSSTRKGTEEVHAGLPSCLRPIPLAVTPNTFPMPSAFGVRIPKIVNAILRSCSGVKFLRFAIKDAFKFGLDVLSAAHATYLRFGLLLYKLLIPFLSPKRKPLQDFTCKGLEKLVGRAGVEPATLCLKGRYSTY